MNQHTKRELNRLVEAHLSSVISNSIAIARHSKRPRRTIHSSDIRTALQLEGTPIQLPTNAGYTDNTPVDLNEFLEHDMDPQEEAPAEIGMVMHWLAVEGKQPATPLNPFVVAKMEQERNNQELEDYNDGSYGSGNVSSQGHGHGSTNINGISNNNNRGSHRHGLNSDNVAIRNLLPRLLSEELQLYFTRITLALQRGTPQDQDAALLRLRYDSGIQELLPFFFNFLTPTGNSQMADVQRSLLRIRCVHNLALNPNIHLEIYLQKVIPLVLNCIVPKKLSLNAYDHWKLRDEASRTLLVIWKIYGEKYANFQPSVIRVLCDALNLGLESRYGALVALSDLGPKVVDAVVLRYVGKFWMDCQLQLQQCKDDGVRFGLHRLQDALLYSMSVFLGSGDVKRLQILESEKMSDVFGDQLVPFCGSVTNCEYFNCFI